MKELNDMSDEELWTLFPILLTEHQENWKDLYIQEEEQLRTFVGESIFRIRHIGSTAVKGLIAKPTIDILLEIKEDTDTEAFIRKIESIGYIYTYQPGKPAPHMMFMKGYTPQGFKGQAYHLHVRYACDWDETLFCHYLQLHPEVARKYGELKVELKKRYEHDRDAYTESKTEFITSIVQLARKR